MNKRYAFTDIHGNYNLLQKIFKYCDVTDKLYFLGDAADRGPDGLKCIAALLLDSRVTWIKGNHDEFFTNSAVNIAEGRSSIFNDGLWLQNGGAPTITAVEDWHNPQDIQTFVNRMNKKMCTNLILTNEQGKTLYLSHAGFDVDDPLDFPTNESDFWWDRAHLLTPYKNYYDTKETKDRIVIHGHTPVHHLVYKLGETKYWHPEDYEEKFGFSNEIFNLVKNTKDPKIIKYCGGHKIDLDLATFDTGKIALLDLDTLEPIYLKED